MKLTKLHVADEIYKEARKAVQNLIQRKKRTYFKEKLKENTKNLEKLWKTLKQLGLPDNSNDNEKHFFGKNSVQCYNKYLICK